MILAHRLNAVVAFSKVTGTIFNILEGYALKETYVNELQRKKAAPLNGLQRKVWKVKR